MMAKILHIIAVIIPFLFHIEKSMALSRQLINDEHFDTQPRAVNHRNIPSTKDEKDRITYEQNGDQRPILATSLRGKRWKTIRKNENETYRNLMSNIVSTQINSKNDEGQSNLNRAHKGMKTLTLDKIDGENTTKPITSQVINSADPWFYLHGFNEYRLKEYQIM